MIDIFGKEYSSRRKNGTGPKVEPREREREEGKNKKHKINDAQIPSTELTWNRV